MKDNNVLYDHIYEVDSRSINFFHRCRSFVQQIRLPILWILGAPFVSRLNQEETDFAHHPNQRQQDHSESYKHQHIMKQN